MTTIPGRTFVAFSPQDALKIRIAAMKGATQPLCPRCGTGLSTHLRSSGPEGRVALACQQCHQVIVLRLD
jgi:hypothetical protein